MHFRRNYLSSIFISAVSDEFKNHRQRIRHELDRPGLRIEIQESFLAFSDPVLVELDDYIRKCNAVVQIVGHKSGVCASPANVSAIMRRYPDLAAQLHLEQSFLNELSYTQWEAWLAVRHHKKLFLVPGVAADDALVSESQSAHLQSLESKGYYRSEKLRFTSEDSMIIGLLKALHDFMPAAHVPISPGLSMSIGALFKGRVDALVQLEAIVHNGSGGASVTAVFGLGGVGKTQLVAEYASLFGYRFIAILAVSGDAKDFETSVGNLCHVLMLSAAASNSHEDRMQAALSWLEGHSGWLLVVDNVDDDGSLALVAATLRRLRLGTVLVTGRLRLWPKYFQTLQLDVLEEGEAADFLLEYTEGHRAAESVGSDSDSAMILAKELGGLALALTQAACHINKRSLSVSSYLTQWREQRDCLLDDPLFDQLRIGYPHTVAATWKTSYAQLPPDSVLLFDALCWLASTEIPERILHHKWSQVALTRFPGAINAESCIQDSMIPIYDYCLAEPPRTSDRMIRMHRLVKEVGLHWQRKLEAQNDAPIQFISDLVSDDFLPENNLENLSLNIGAKKRALVPHVLALLELSTRAFLHASRAVYLYAELTDFYLSEGRSHEAVQAADCAVRLARACAPDLDPRDAALLQSRSLFHQNRALQSAGQFMPALLAANEAITSLSPYQDEFGVFKDLALIKASSGRIFEQQGEWDKALDVYRAALELREQIDVQEPENNKRELCICLNNVGRILEAKSNFLEAKGCFDKAAREMSLLSINAPPHNKALLHDLATNFGNLGRVNRHLGDWQHAASCLEEADRITRELLAEDRENSKFQRDLAVNLTQQGRLLLDQGLLARAREAFEESLTLREDLVIAFPTNLLNLRELAIAIEDVVSVVSDPEIAIALLGRAVAIKEELCTFAPDNVLWKHGLARSLGQYAVTLQNAKRFSVAMPFIERAISLLEMLSHDAPTRIDYQADRCTFLVRFANIANGLDKFGQARRAFDKALAIAEKPMMRDLAEFKNVSVIIKLARSKVGKK